MASSEDAEVAALDRVLTRTVMTKDEDLQQLLVKLLPALVQKLATTQPKTRAKTLELLNHINKRVKALPATALPLLPLVQLAVSADGSPMVRSFGLVYVEMGVSRAPPPDQLAAVPLLLSGLSKRTPQHQAVALRVVTQALSSLQPAPGGSYSQVTVPGCSSPVNAVNLIPVDPVDRQLFLRHALKLLLYQRPSSGGRALIQTPLGLANAATAAMPAAAAAAAATADALRAQPGLSGADVAALEEKGVPHQEVLIKQKLGLLSLLAAAAAGMPGNAVAAAEAAAAAAATAGGSNAPAAAADATEGMDVDQPAAAAAARDGTNGSSSSTGVFLTSEELLLPLLAASCDPYEAVARCGADLLVKVVNPDAAKPAVDLEQAPVAVALMGLLLGDQDPTAVQPAPQPAGPAMAVRIMQLLVRSVAATSIFPGAVLVMHACLSGPSSSPRLVRLGAEWTGWVFKHAPPHQLKAMAGPVTHRLLSALGLSDEGGDTPAANGGSSDAAAAAGSSGGGSSSGALAALSGSAEARGHVFSALAQLANRMPDLFKDNTHLASRLFGALSVEAPGSRTALQEALGALAGALAGGIQQQQQQQLVRGTAAAAVGVDGARLAEVEELLMSSIKSEQAAVRLCAAQWASRLFPRSHMPSRYVLLLASGDTKPEVRDVGLTGLGLHPSQFGPGLAPSAYRAAVGGLGLPAPAAVVGHLLSQHKQLGLNGDLSRPLPLPDASCQALMAFLKASGTAAAAAAADSSPQQQQQQLADYDPAAHAVLLENLACRGAGRDTVAAALEGLVGLLGGSAEWMTGRQDEAEALQARYAARQQWLLHWLSHNHLPVRSAAAQLLALSASSIKDATAAEALLTLLLANLPTVSPGSSSSSKLLEEQEGSMLAVGLVLARAHSTGTPVLSAQQQQAAVTVLYQQLTHHGSTGSSSSSEPPVGSSSGSSSGRSVVLAGAAALALGYCGLVGVPLPGVESPTTPPPAAAAAAANGSGSSDTAGSNAEPPPLLRLLFGLAGSKDSRAVLRAVTAVGYIGAGSSREGFKLAAANGLLSAVCVKGVSEEVLLAAGEALAAIAGDIEGFDPQLLLWSSYDTIADCVDAQQQQQQASSAMQVDGTAGQQTATAAEGGQAGVQEFLLGELCGRLCVSTKEEVRCAGVVVLVCLLQLCSGSGLVRGQLPRLQSTFTGLLGDSNDLTQDLAARGVSLVYSRGGAGLQQQLLGQLLGLLQGSAGPAGGPGSSAAGAAGVKLAPDTKLFEEGQLGNTPGGAGLTTYRELCSLANEMGQPDLIYRFMDLARASSNLSAKRGAAVGVARIARLAASAAGQEEGGGGLASLLGPERLAALLPKLYRLTHDPSAKVADSMSAIWAALLDDPRAELDTHFDPIARSLLCDMGARLWRVRQAGAAGLTDLLAGRRWGQLAPHMEQMWTMALRAFDDVKESVRAAAAGLLRSLRGLSLRLMDRQQTPAADVAACCQVVLPLLAGSQGLGSGVEEVRAIATDVLCSGIKTAGPAQVLPVLPVVVPVLLEALSGLEDARLNYVEQHAERVGIDAEKLAAARLAAARASSLTEALDACCRSLTGPAAAEMVPGLAALVRRGVGLNTKAGTARFIKGLAARLGSDLKPAAPTLLKPLVAAVASEGSGAVRKAYAGAAAALAVRCVGDKRRDKFVTDAVAAYGAVPVPLQPVDVTAAAGGGGGGQQQQQQAVAVPMSGVESAGGGVDDSSRQAGGLLLRELLRESGDTFSKYASQILPVAFIATHDETPSVASAWSGVWSEGCPSEPAALRLHAPELAGLVAGGLASSSWGRKRSAAKALVVLCDVAAHQLSPYAPQLAQQLLAEGAEGRLWEGKEGLLAALGALGAACASTLCVNPGLPVLLQGLLSAAARKKTAYRTAALAALQQVLDALPPLLAAGTVDGVSVWQVVSPPMLQALQQQLEAASTPPAAAAAAEGGGVVDEEVKPLPLVEACNCLASAWKVLSPAQQADAAPQLVPLLLGLLSAPGFSWSTWAAVVSLAAALTAAAAAAGGSSSSSGAHPVVSLVPLAAGLVHVLQHSTISQLRLKCLETLLQLLQLIQADPAAAAVFKSATAAAAPQQQQQADSNGSVAGSSLPAVVSACLSGVSANDPSVAHKALAAQAAAVLGQMGAAS